MADPVNDSLLVLNNVRGTINPFLSQAVYSIVILLIGLVVGRIVGNLISRSLNQLGTDAYFKKIGVGFSVEKGVSGLVSSIIYLITAVIFFNSLGISLVIVNILFGVSIFLLAGFLILSLRDVFPNFISGLKLKSKKNFDIGSKIEVSNVKGKVISFNLFETRIKTSKGDEIIIPNALFSKEKLKIKRK
jgi:small-conductance mechanosensitive channel